MPKTIAFDQVRKEMQQTKLLAERILVFASSICHRPKGSANSA
ncbi:hypothetical protein DSM3645_12566 [Blastopirellula marina DSM 3645]|uniref:Uncharacterized protein n=1 Tax=Blastopirellula marina DSM 3645 TaxID=314230 RepID=A3ZRT3_9BACT|nr:hypothetical protein DSM3645_12566 [Blastopirellula marina DSM 3645]